MSDFDLIDWIKQTNIQAALIGPVITGFSAAFLKLISTISEEKKATGTLIQDIEEAGIKHWCLGKKNDNKETALKIQYLLQTLGWKINQDDQDIKACFIAYRQALTGGDFDNPNKKNLALDEPRIDLIRNSAKNLRKSLKIKKHH